MRKELDSHEKQNINIVVTQPALTGEDKRGVIVVPGVGDR
jgi:hypothetical protein